ncbi:MAG: biopolymer transporter ExbD [Bacteroidota bacterium]
MALNNKSKVNAEFNTSALTDIIFLLLIFFMLTSSLVAPNSLNMKLPGSSRSKATASSKIDQIMIRGGGRYFLNDRRIGLEELESYFRQKARGGKTPTAAIGNSSDATNGDVVAIMDMALRLNINTVLTTDI